MDRAPLAALLVALTLAASAQQPPSIDPYHQAIRNDDLAALRTLVAAEGTNARDAAGMTPLMLASAFGSRGAARLLVEAGADVKAASNGGVTALHLAWGDIEVARLLLDRGADVHAKTQLGSTPLLVAASAGGTADVVALLLHKGADPNAAENRGVTPLIAAATVGNTAAARLLLARGADADAHAPGQGQTATALIGAAHSGDLELTRLLLARKPDVDAKSADRDANVKNGPVLYGHVTALHTAAVNGYVDVVRALLDAGATVDARDVRGMTPLMWAIASDHAEPRVVRLLLARGASSSLAANTGESALDWARKYNDPTILPVLKLAAQRVTGGAPPLAPAHAAAAAREAVERSLPLVHTSATRVMSDGGCVACHAQPMAALAADMAAARGWRVEPPAAEMSQIGLGITTSVAGLLQGREAGGLPDSHMYNMMVMIGRKAPPSIATDTAVYYLAAKQRAAGHWRGLATRPPIQDRDFNRTAMGIRTLAVYGTPARRSEMAARIARAAAWLAAQTPRTTEDRIWQLLGLAWAGAHADVRETRTRELLALQRPDGGWAQTAYLASDAYATGQVLYALRETGRPAADAAIRRGVAFLLRTQAADGTWHVKSRAMKIQPYFESGFPYGHDQWISQAGTAWAAIGLTMAAGGEPAATATR